MLLSWDNQNFTSFHYDNISTVRPLNFGKAKDVASAFLFPNIMRISIHLAIYKLATMCRCVLLLVQYAYTYTSNILI